MDKQRDTNLPELVPRAKSGAPNKNTKVLSSLLSRIDQHKNTQQPLTDSRLQSHPSFTSGTIAASLKQRRNRTLLDHLDPSLSSKELSFDDERSTLRQILAREAFQRSESSKEGFAALRKEPTTGPLAKEIARQEAVKVKALKKKMVEVQEEKEVLQRVMEEEDKERVQRESELQVERGNLTLKVVAAAIQIQRCWRGHFLRKRVIRPYVDLRSWQLRQMTANILLAPVDNVLEALNQFKAQLEKAAIAIQSYGRTFIAKKQLRRRKRKVLGAILDAKVVKMIEGLALRIVYKALNEHAEAVRQKEVEEKNAEVGGFFVTSENKHKSSKSLRSTSRSPLRKGSSPMRMYPAASPTRANSIQSSQATLTRKNTINVSKVEWDDSESKSPARVIREVVGSEQNRAIEIKATPPMARKSSVENRGSEIPRSNHMEPQIPEKSYASFSNMQTPQKLLPSIASSLIESDSSFSSDQGEPDAIKSNKATKPTTETPAKATLSEQKNKLPPNERKTRSSIDSDLRQPLRANIQVSTRATLRRDSESSSQGKDTQRSSSVNTQRRPSNRYIYHKTGSENPRPPLARAKASNKVESKPQQIIPKPPTKKLFLSDEESKGPKLQHQKVVHKEP